jgi:hypothetical protein
MASKTLGALLVIIMLIILFPIGIGILGGVFGIVFGVIGGVFGAMIGVVGAIFGAIFGTIGWIFEGISDWDHNFGFFNLNFCTIALLIVLVLVLSKNRTQRRS